MNNIAIKIREHSAITIAIGVISRHAFEIGYPYENSSEAY